MARHSGIFVLLFSTLAMLAGTNARAQSARALDLRWLAPAACPQQRGVRERIEKLVGSKRSNEGKFSAEGTITQSDEGRFHLKLVVRAGRLIGERNIESKSCEHLAGAAAVALALLMQSDKPLTSGTFGDSAANTNSANTNSANTNSANTNSANTNSANTNSATSGDASSSVTDTANSDEAHQDRADQYETLSDDGGQVGPAATGTERTQSPRRVRARIQVPMVALGIGPLPLPSFGLALGAGASVDEWIFFLQFAKWSQQHLTVAGFPAYGADVDRATVNLAACRAFRRDVFEVAPCLVMSVEHLSASGSGDRVVPRSPSASWLAPGLGGQARVYFTDWFALGASVTGQIETARPQISIAGTGVGSGFGVGEVDRLGPAAVTVLVGSEWIL